MADPCSPEDVTVLLEKTTEFLVVRLYMSADRLKLYLDCRRAVFEFRIEEPSSDSSDAPTDEAKEKPSEETAKQELSAALKALDHTVTSEEILSIIEQKADRSLLDESMIERIAGEVDKGTDVVKRRIAKGTAPQEGEDGRLQLLVKKYDESRNEDDEDDHKSDLRETHFFDNIAAGQIIGRIYPPQEGTDGTDALGKTIRAGRVQKAKASFDKSIVRSPSKNGAYEELTSEVNGFLSEEGGKLRVHGTFSVKEDVDFKTGNLDFIGDIEVNGSVMKDFIVAAQGNVLIKGDIQSGFVRAPCGGVEINGTIIGGFGIMDTNSDAIDADNIARMANTKKATVLAKEGLKTNSIRGARIEVEGDVEVVKEIMGSSIRTKGAVRMPEGQLLGGSTYAARGVDAAVIGTSAGSRTTIVLCTELETSSHYSTLLQSISSHEEAVTLLKLQLGPLIEHPERIKALDQEQKKKISAMYNKFLQVQESLDGLVAARDKMKREITRACEVRVNVRRVIFPGVEIIAEGRKFVVEQEIKGSKSITFNSETKTFSVGTLKPLDKQTPADKQPAAEATPEAPAEAAVEA